MGKGDFDSRKRRLVVLLAIIGIGILLVNLSLLSSADVRSKIKNIPIAIPIPIPGTPKSGHAAPPDPNVGCQQTCYLDTMAGYSTDKDV